MVHVTANWDYESGGLSELMGDPLHIVGSVELMGDPLHIVLFKRLLMTSWTMDSFTCVFSLY